MSPMPILRTLLAFAVCALAGCAAAPIAQVQNPIFVAGGNFDTLWGRTADVVDDYFDIGRESRLEGRIETVPRPAATILEPWHRDSVDSDERIDATLQSIRRRCVVQITPVEGGHSVEIQVHKELEDLPQPAFASAGQAIFRNEAELHREQDIIGPVAFPIGWIPLGRDPKLEARMMADLQRALFQRPGNGP